MRSATLLTAAALAFTAQAQAPVPTYDSALNMTIADPGTIDEATRGSWCRAQSDSCTTLCDKDATENDCDLMTLSYNCTCASNNSAPALQYYQQTMPTFICTELFQTCITQHTSDAQGQEDCTTNINDLCGTIPPSKASTGGDDDDDEDDDDSSTTTSAASTPTPTSEDNEGGSSDNSDNSDSSDNSDDNGGGSAGIALNPHGAVTMLASGVVAGVLVAFF